MSCGYHAVLKEVVKKKVTHGMYGITGHHTVLHVRCHFGGMFVSPRFAVKCSFLVQEFVIGQKV